MSKMRVTINEKVSKKYSFRENVASKRNQSVDQGVQYEPPHPLPPLDLPDFEWPSEEPEVHCPIEEGPKTRGKVIVEAKFPPQFFGLFDACFAPKGDYFVTCFGQGAIQLRFTQNGELKKTIRSGGTHSLPAMCARFQPRKQDTFYVGSSCGTLFQCSTTKGDFNKFAEENKNEICAMDINYNGDNIVTGGRDTKIRIYDTQTSSLKFTYERPKYPIDTTDEQRFHRLRIFSIKFHPRMTDVFLSGGWDDEIKIWDLRDPNGSVRKIYGPHICGDAIDIIDKQIITGAWVVNKSLQLWDFGSGELIGTIVPKNRVNTIYGEFLYSCHYYGGDDGLVVVGGSGTGFVEVINIKEQMIIGAFKVDKPCQTIDCYQNKILYGGMEPIVRIVDFSST